MIVFGEEYFALELDFHHMFDSDCPSLNYFQYEMPVVEYKLVVVVSSLLELVVEQVLLVVLVDLTELLVLDQLMDD